MIKIYSVLNTSIQTIVEVDNYTPQQNEILMQSERPTIEHIAQADGTWSLPIPDLSDLKQQKLAQIAAWTASAITGGFVSSCSGQSVRYDSDKDTQLTMQGIALNVDSPLFASNYPNGCPVRGYVGDGTEKTIQMLTAAQVMQWQADLSLHIGAQKQRGWTLQTAVAVATTAEELEQITW